MTNTRKEVIKVVNVNELKAEIVRKGFTQKEVYEGIGLSKRQWEIRIEKKKFDSDDIFSLINFVGIENPMPIFFADEVT